MNMFYTKYTSMSSGISGQSSKVLPRRQARGGGRRAAGKGRPESPQGGPEAIDPLLKTRLKALSVLLHRQWSLVALAELRGGDVGPGGAKFVTLLHRLGCGRASLKAALDHLKSYDYISHNPGYGHPMRPEYLLAERGHDAASAAVMTLAAIHAAGAESLLLRKWPLPALLAADAGLPRFGRIKAALDGVTSRALALALKDLENAGLIERRVDGGFPPAAAYLPTVAADPILGSAKALLQSLS